MAIVDRWTHYPEQLSEEILVKEAKYDALEAKLGGFPPKKRMVPMFGKEKSGAFIWEREWNDIKEMEAAYTREYNDPGFAEINKSGPDFGPYHREVFYVIDDIDG